MSQTGPETRPLSSGIVIAGGYADKIRRTLFAQLRDYIKQDKEMAREVARASGELNFVLYRILVEELKVDKIDAVRIRINYTVDPSAKRVTWDYNSLRIEVFKRVPDEQIAKKIEELVKTGKLEEYVGEFAKAPRAAEEEARAFELREEEIEEAPRPVTPPPAPTPPTPQPTPPPVVPTIREVVASAVVIGETIDGGLALRLVDSEGHSAGIATITPVSEGELAIDAIVMQRGDLVKRCITRVKGRLDEYSEDPQSIIKVLERAQCTEITKRDAEQLIREKMQSIV